MVALAFFNLIGLIGYISLIGLVGLIGLIGLIGIVGLISLVGLTGCIGLNGHIGCNSLIGNVIVVNLGLVRIYYEIKTKPSQCYLFVRETWLCSVLMDRLDSYSYFRDILLFSKQSFSGRLLLMTKYYIMRDC
jgi:hypothetical protein